MNAIGVIHSGGDPIRRIQVTPDDAFFATSGSWGQDFEDQWAVKMNVLTPEVLAELQPVADSEPVVVAVIDTGLAWNHRDIGVDRLWFNSGEIPTNNIDDDGNGYVDDIVGWNFFDQSNLPWDTNGHGTLVAGIIGAGQSNDRGIAGINPHVRLMVLKAMDEAGNGYASQVAEAIVYAANNGAQIINLSVGGEQLTLTEQIAIDYARSRNVLVVAAAGNENIELEDYGPGGADGVLTVAASDRNNRRQLTSNWGTAVDLTAPGVDVLGPRAIGTDLLAQAGHDGYTAEAHVVGDDKAYYRATGTSFSTAIVSGAASLLLAANPSLSADELERKLTQSAMDIDVEGMDQFTGYGLLDLLAAHESDAAFYVDARISDASLVGSTESGYISITGTADADSLSSATVWIGAGDTPAQWLEIRTIESPVVDGMLAEIDLIEFESSPRWTLRLLSRHENGREREARYMLNFR